MLNFATALLATALVISPLVSAQVSEYGQCGGTGYLGSTSEF